MHTSKIASLQGDHIIGIIPIAELIIIAVEAPNFHAQGHTVFVPGSQRACIIPGGSEKIYTRSGTCAGRAVGRPLDIAVH